MFDEWNSVTAEYWECWTWGGKIRDACSTNLLIVRVSGLKAEFEGQHFFLG